MHAYCFHWRLSFIFTFVCIHFCYLDKFFFLVIAPLPLANSEVYHKVHINKGLLEFLFIYGYWTWTTFLLYIFINYVSLDMPQMYFTCQGRWSVLRCGTEISLYPISIPLPTPSCVSLKYKRHGLWPQDLLKFIYLPIPRLNYTEIFSLFAILMQ